MCILLPLETPTLDFCHTLRYQPGLNSHSSLARLVGTPKVVWMHDKSPQSACLRQRTRPACGVCRTRMLLAGRKDTSFCNYDHRLGRYKVLASMHFAGSQECFHKSSIRHLSLLLKTAGAITLIVQFVLPEWICKVNALPVRSSFIFLWVISILTLAIVLVEQPW